MVHGKVHLKDGETVMIEAEDMLSALEQAEQYRERAWKLDFKTVEVNAEDGGKTNVHAKNH